MCAVYDKALKRRDFGGIVPGAGTGSSANAGKKAGGGPTSAGEKAGIKSAPGKKEAKKEKENNNPTKIDGADIGKIVQLMSQDAERCANMASGIYALYGAPFEIIIAVTFLYQ